MSQFGRHANKGAADQETEIKHGKVTKLQASPESGKRRIVARESEGLRQAFTIDIPFKEAAKVKRKKTYSFDVYEAEAKSKSYGGQERRKSFSSTKGFKSDKAPTESDGFHAPQFKDFGSDNRLKDAQGKF